MADYFTSFSCLFDVGSAANVAPARTILAQLGEKLETEEDGAALGFTMQSDEGSGPGMLCLYSEEDGEPEHVIAFVKLCAEAFALTGRWGFHWALTCSRPRPAGFGGGAHVLDLATGSAEALKLRLNERPTRYNFAIGALEGLVEAGSDLIKKPLEIPKD